MKKLRGSYIAKIIAWIVCIGCALGTIVYGFFTIVGVSEDYFNATRAEMLTDAYRNVNSAYSAEAYQNMTQGRSNKALGDEGFRYGIFQTDNIAKVDFKDSRLYLDTNMTTEDFDKLDSEKLFLYGMWETADGGSEGSSYGFVGDWEDLTELDRMESRLESKYGIVWHSQYADAVCFDVAKGIFYYRSDNKYYPAQMVDLRYTDADGNTQDYTYIYDFDRGQYHYEEYMVDAVAAAEVAVYGPNTIQLLPEEKIAVVEEAVPADEAMPAAEINDATTFHTYTDGLSTSVYGAVAGVDVVKVLTGIETDGYVDLSKLSQTDFYIYDWEGITLDNVRFIDGYDLTIIDSNKMNNASFISEDIGYYLNESYTLFVAHEVDVQHYWIASLIPEPNATVAQGSKYQAAAAGIELFYTYGNNAYAAAVFFAIMTLVSFIYLVYACGYRTNQEGIVLTWFDKLPLEIISAAVFLAEGLLIGAGLEIAYGSSRIIIKNPSVYITFGVSAVIGFCIIGLWYVLSLCVRVKNGKWWQNSICYKVCHFCWKIVKKLLENISLLWKLVVLAVANLAVTLFIVAGFDAEVLLFFWLIENVVFTIAACYAVLQITELQKAAAKMADGNLNYKVQTEKMFSPCKTHGDNLNKIGDGLSKAVDERIKSERFKTELITNVSHDIKTPLTSIINYVDLLEKEELHNEKAEEYLDVLERQSSKLKKLIEDLVEASKASTGNLEVGNELLEAGVFLTQTVGEFEEKLSLAGLELIVQKPEEKLYILADGRHLWRVVDNLMNNICKYAQPSSRVYVNLEKEQEEVVITFRNISKYQLNINGSELTERFVRGDSSRNTEGHGLGLSIAKSLMDLIGGKMQIVVDGDLFKVVLRFLAQDGENETDTDTEQN